MTRLLLLALCACSAAPDAGVYIPQRFDADLEAASAAIEHRVTAETFLAPLRALAAPFSAPPVVRQRGTMRIETGDTACDYDYDLPRPYVSAVWREPRVGEQVAADFWTSGIGAPPWPQLLLVEVRDTYDTAKFPADSLGFPSCWLHVDLAHAKAVWPGSEETNWARLDGSRIKVRLVPTPDMVGKTIVMQSVVILPTVYARSGIVLGPALLVCVGEAR